jgi:hypothetical protein
MGRDTPGLAGDQIRDDSVHRRLSFSHSHRTGQQTIAEARGHYHFVEAYQR